MRILHIGPKNYPPSHGGVEKVVFNLIENISEHEFSIFVEWNQKESKFIKILPKGLISQIRSIDYFINNNDIEVLHFHKEPFILHALYFSLIKKSTIITIHGCAWRIRRWPLLYRAGFYLLDLLASLFIKKVIFVGQEDYSYFSNIVFWRKLYFIPNGVIINNNIASNDIRKCVFIGRISPEKNILKMIELIKSSDKELAIYGPFDIHNTKYKFEVMEAIRGSKNIKYLGVLGHEKILSTLSQYNTFINISFSEGMPVSVLEAASVGLNLVLSDIPQHKNLKFPDVIYVNPHKPAISKNFKTISMRNKEHTEKTFSLNRTLDSYRMIYNLLQQNEKKHE